MPAPHDNSVFVYIICGQDNDKNRWEFNQKGDGGTQSYTLSTKSSIEIFCVH